MARKTKADRDAEAAEAELRVAAGAIPSYHLEATVPKGKHVFVEVATPIETVSYDQGDDHGGKLDLTFPTPAGESLLRIVQQAKDGTREAIHSEVLNG